MAFRTRWTRLPARGPGAARVLALAAALAAAAPVAACTPAPASSDTSVSGSGSTARAAGDITAAQAGQVFDRFVAAANAASPRPGSPLLALATGVERAVLSATLGSHSVVVSGTPSGPAGAYGSSLSVQPGLGRYAYGPPAYYLPQAGGYPRFFVASVTRAPQGAKPAGGGTGSIGTGSIGTGSIGMGSIGGPRAPAGGPVLMLFDQARANAPWLLASVSQLPPGVTPPRLAADGAGYVPTVPLPDASLVAQPGDIGPLQAAVVDDGPASAASKVVAAGPLTTGLYQAARDHAGGLAAPPGDVYQWELDGASFPEFALRTAAGGALVFYAMSLDTTVAVPDVINKGNPVRSGPPIPVPADVRALLPASQAAPLIQLQSQQTLSFAAVDPAPGSAAKIQVIAEGGGLTGASAS